MKKSIVCQNEAQIGQILGIDFGKSKVGLAIADQETRMAFAYDVLSNDKAFWLNLKEIVASENVKLIVVGMTKHQNDQESEKTKQTFVKELRKKLTVEIALQEEMFTTKMAQANLKAKGMKNVAKHDDAEAARIILQAWLDRNL